MKPVQVPIIWLPVILKITNHHAFQGNFSSHQRAGKSTSLNVIDGCIRVTTIFGWWNIDLVGLTWRVICLTRANRPWVTWDAGEVKVVPHPVVR